MTERPLIGPADLLRGKRWLRDDPEAQEALARLCGYRKVADGESPPESEASKGGTRGGVGEPRRPPPPPPPPRGGKPATLPGFLRAVRYTPRDAPVVESSERPASIGDQGVTVEDLRVKAAGPAPPPLLPWSRMWPFLRQALGSRRPGRRVDLKRLIGRLARLEPVRDLPRRPVLVWAPQAWVIVDQRSDLAPFHADFEHVIRRLDQQRGRIGLRCDRLDDQGPLGTARCWWSDRRHSIPPDRNVPLLLLGDLGCLSPGDDWLDCWRRFTLRLHGTGTSATALMPCPRSRWDPKLAALWRCVLWDRGEPLRRRQARGFPTSPEPPVGDPSPSEKLLNLLAPALRIEPYLLRSARGLLPAGAADIGAEFDVWHHPEMARTRDAIAFRHASIPLRRTAFAQLDAPLKRAFAKLLDESHQHLSVTFFARETLNLCECGAAVPDEQENDAIVTLRRLNRTMFDSLTDKPELSQRLLVFEWQRGDFSRCVPAARGTPETAAAWALARLRSEADAVPVPDGIDRKEVERVQESVLGAPPEPVSWHIYRAGTEVVWGRVAPNKRGQTPLGTIKASSPGFFLVVECEDQSGSALHLVPSDGGPPL